MEHSIALIAKSGSADAECEKSPEFPLELSDAYWMSGGLV